MFSIVTGGFQLLVERCFTSPYFRPAEPSVFDAMARLLAERQPRFVFLNQVALAALVPDLRPLLNTGCKIILLSHGLESTDLLHLIRLRRRLPLSGRVRPTPAIALGHSILMESNFRKQIDLVCALSPFDAEIERWVGAARVGWLPRTIEPDPLEWRPIGERLGFLGTLDHAPNLEGLVNVLDSLICRETGSTRIRIVVVPSNWKMACPALFDCGLFRPAR